MADQMVLKTQQWLNQTYNGKTGYIAVTENGNTGWNTIYALRRALQIELGITATSSNFGPSTTANFIARFPNGVIQQSPDDETESNIYAIIQGACWCKGYSTGASNITKHFYSGTGKAIKQLKTGAGCADKTSTVTLNVMKALLSMNQFVLLSSGNVFIQQIQQKLNNKYEAYIGLIPCDGLYGRSMNQAMIKVLQSIEGYSVEDATGNFGSGTKANLPIVPNSDTLSEEKEIEAINLVRYSLCCNGYDIAVNYEGWDSALEDTLKQFQNDMCINQTGICDTDTWMSLLLSKGNPDRSCIACDTRFEITESRMKYLKNNGFQIVGRYLTGGDFKELRPNEVQNIINNGLKFFPIFQESAADLSYFTSSRGIHDAKVSVNAARKHGIPVNTIIYFAVDTDPTDSEISSYIMPYFKSLYENMTKAYKIGVYGTRNVCTQVMNAGYAETCFVSDMSTGYSGNMGFKMPSNWNLDQFHEIKNITISNFVTMDLDKVAYSGKFPVVETLYDSIYNYISKIRDLETLYLEYKNSKNESCTVTNLILGITNFLRSFKYSSDLWYVATLAEINTEFIDYVKNNDLSLYNDLAVYANSNSKTLYDSYSGNIDIGHLAATIEGYLSATLIPGFWFGWGGDLASLMKQVANDYNANGGNRLDIANSLIGEPNSSFQYADICSDSDAIKIGKMLKSSTGIHPLSDILNQYYSTNAEQRISYFLLDLENVNIDFSNLSTAIFNKMSGVFENTILIPILGVALDGAVKNACCDAFAQYIINNYPTI